MLEIVEEKQPRPVERLPDLVEQGTLVVLLDLECARDRREHERRIGDGARSTKTLCACCAATARARRVLPVPPVPVNVTSRVSGLPSRAATAVTSSSRPIRSSSARPAAAAAAGGERGILPEDGLLELSQLGGRVDAELLDENAARFLVGGERIRLPARPIERKHQLAA